MYFLLRGSMKNNDIGTRNIQVNFSFYSLLSPVNEYTNVTVRASVERFNYTFNSIMNFIWSLTIIFCNWNPVFSMHCILQYDLFSLSARQPVVPVTQGVVILISRHLYFTFFDNPFSSLLQLGYSFTSKNIFYCKFFNFYQL